MAKKHILLLEDEQEIAELFEIGLRASGYLVDIASSIAQAHQRLNTRRYDLVIVDIRLPDGDGRQIANRAADLGSKTYILSGSLVQLSANSIERHEVLMKPLRPSELVAAASRAIGPAEDPAISN